MVDPDARGSGSGNTAIVAIVVLVLVAVLAFLFFFNGGTDEPAVPEGPDVELNVEPPDMPEGGGEGGE